MRPTTSPSLLRLVPSCFVIFDLELLSLSFDFVFSSEIFKSLSFRLDRLCRLAILCLDQHAHTLHHLESLLTISLDRLDIFEGRSCISEFVRKILESNNSSIWRVETTAVLCAVLLFKLCVLSGGMFRHQDSTEESYIHFVDRDTRRGSALPFFQTETLTARLTLYDFLSGHRVDRGCTVCLTLGSLYIPISASTETLSPT
ncbi:hypothetical protein Tco_0715991 [Tanacetum coccineum]